MQSRSVVVGCKSCEVITIGIHIGIGIGTGICIDCKVRYLVAKEPSTQ